jgi:hypothetical protein
LLVKRIMMLSKMHGTTINIKDEKWVYLFFYVERARVKNEVLSRSMKSGHVFVLLAGRT